MPYKTEDDIRKHFLPVSFPSSLSFLPLFFLPLQHSLQWHPPIPAPRSRNPRLSNNNLLPMSICPMECPLPLRNCMIRTSSTCLLWNLAMFSSSCSTYCWDFFLFRSTYIQHTHPLYFTFCALRSISRFYHPCPLSLSQQCTMFFLCFHPIKNSLTCLYSITMNLLYLPLVF